MARRKHHRQVVAIEALEPRQLLSASTLTDSQKQQLILQMVDAAAGPLPPELVLAEIRQEGGAGAFFANGSLYNTFYSASQSPWAQPDDNSDGILQVTPSSGFYQRSGTYSDDQAGYDHAIIDGCGYLIQTFDAYGTPWETSLHYNTGPSSLYVYLGLNGGDRQYLAHIASDLQSFVPSIYPLANAALVNQLNAAQTIVNSFLNNKSILSGQSPSYYAPFETQMDAQLHALGASGVVTDTWTGAASNQWSNAANWSNNAVPKSANNVEFNMGAAVASSVVNIAALIVSDATLQLAPGAGASKLTSLAIYGTADLDISTNSLAINYGSNPSPAASVASYLSAGYNAGAWTGPGIISSAAAGSNGKSSIGYADGNADSGTPAKANQVLVEFTPAADANLDGTVGFADLVAVAENFGSTGDDWVHGNFNYDPSGSVGFADLALVAENFGQTTPVSTLIGSSPARVISIPAVPWPGANPSPSDELPNSALQPLSSDPNLLA